MTRPPRKKYPSDNKNYHEMRKPGCAHTIRLPEELLETYVTLKRCLGPKSSHADVMRFLFEAADPAITAVIQAEDAQIVRDSQLHPLSGGCTDSDSEFEEVGDDPEGSDISDEETREEAGQITEIDVYDILCGDSQVQNVLPDPPLRTYPNATYGFWSKTKVQDFFLKFHVFCPTEGCSRKFLPPRVNEFQQVWNIQLKCPAGHTYSFLSGDLEKDHGIPDITGKLYHAALCAGMTHQCLESLSEEVGIHVPRKQHFFDFQSRRRRSPGWISATLDLWEEQKGKLQQDLLAAGTPLVLYVDCRFDSSRSGYHGTLPVINMEDERVVEMVTLTRKEAGSSWKIETMALEQALTKLKQKGLTIAEVIHDDNASVDAILNEHGILSSKDLWHKCKNVMTKFKETLQEKRRSPTDCSVEGATTIAQVVVFSVQTLKDFCKDNGLPVTGNKLQLVQRVSLCLNLPEAGASNEIQRQRPLRYPELAAHDIAYKLKSWIYTCAKNAAARGDTTPTILTADVHNAADHWASNHSTCRTLPGVCKCVVENWPEGRDCKYPEGGETHKAVKDFLKKYLTEKKMKFYLKARENFMSETFHSVINKYATKRIHFDASHTARLACATLDWNENVRREVRAVYNRQSNDTAVRRRARTNRDLVARTSVWKAQLKSRVFA